MPPTLEVRSSSLNLARAMHTGSSAGNGGAPVAGEGDRSAGGTRGSVRVLIVDDNMALAENIAEMMEIDGYATEVAATAEEGLAKALAHRISVLITDFRLPRMNGAELIRRLRQERGKVHAMVISAYSDDDTIGDATRAGAAFMTKPLDFTALSRFVRGSLREGSA